MKVKELLSDREVVTIAPGASTLEASQRMAEARVGALLVVGEDGGPIGIFTERDLMVRVVAAARLPAEVRVEEVMTRELFTTSADVKVLDLRAQMRERHIRHVPVVEGERVLAVLSTRDLVRAALRETRQEAKRMTEYIQDNPFQS